MLPEFKRLAPIDAAEAIKLWYDLYGRACIYAGGTDVFVQMREGRLKPEYLLDLKGIDELKGIRYSPETGMQVGALTTFGEIESSTLVRSTYPVLFDGANRIGSVQVRNRATIGGNVCSALPSADSVPGLMVLGARIEVKGMEGVRDVPIESFFTAPGKTVLSRGEILTRILLPPAADCGGGAYVKFTRRKAMDLALLGVAVYLECLPGSQTCNRAKIALAAAAPTPMRAREAESYLEGRDLNSETLRKAGTIAAGEARPRSSFRATAEYRRDLLAVLVPRAAICALDRINDGRPAQREG